MNNRGQVQIFVVLMLGIVFFILGMALAPALKDITQEAKDDPQLNCSTTTDDQTKAICASIEMQQIYVGVIFGLAAMLLGGMAIR